MLKKGFALIEILIALTILSVTLLSVFTGVSSSANAMLGIKNKSIAIIAAKSKMNEFIVDEMRGLDLNREILEEYEGFTYSRETKRWENETLEELGFNPALLNIQITAITIHWFENNREKEYFVEYIYSKK